MLLKRPLKNVQFCPRPRQAKILTTGIHLVFRGLKFEPNAGIGRKGTFFKGLLRALEVLLTGGDSDVYNLGNSQGYSVREVIETARKVTGHPIPFSEVEKSRLSP